MSRDANERETHAGSADLMMQSTGIPNLFSKKALNLLHLNIR
jgi:hypothetical protein